MHLFTANNQMADDLERLNKALHGVTAARGGMNLPELRVVALELAGDRW